MNPPRPPPLPLAADFKSAVITYVRAAVYLVTALAFIVFAHTFIHPKIEQLWMELGQKRSGPLLAMFSAVNFLKSNAVFIVLGIMVLVGVLEASTRWWRRVRGFVVELIVYLTVLSTIFMYAMIASAASVLVPVILKEHRTSEEKPGSAAASPLDTKGR